MMESLLPVFSQAEMIWGSGGNLHADGGDHLVRFLAFQHLFQMVIAAQTPQTSHLFCCMVRYVPDRSGSPAPGPAGFPSGTAARSPPPPTMRTCFWLYPF